MRNNDSFAQYLSSFNDMLEYLGSSPSEISQYLAEEDVSFFLKGEDSNGELNKTSNSVEQDRPIHSGSESV